MDMNPSFPKLYRKRWKYVTSVQLVPSSKVGEGAGKLMGCEQRPCRCDVHAGHPISPGIPAVYT